MVGRLLLVLCLGSITTSFATSNGHVTANELKQYLRATEQEKLSAGERLKALRGDPSSLKLLNERSLFYKLPNGTYVKGLLLPNGKVGPSINVGNKQVTACVTNTHRLIPGVWDTTDRSIVCSLEQNESFAVLEGDMKQKAVSLKKELKRQPQATPKTANKYNNKTPKKITHEQSAQTNQLDNKQPIKATKYGGSSSAIKIASLKTAESKYIYNPPKNRSSASKTVAGVLERDTEKFGIPVGTWIKARLMRPASSAERGLIEFETKEAVFGKYKDLPARTILFANKYINSTDEKMEAMTVNARLPNGEEIQVSATIHSLDQTAGLPGKLIRDRKGEIMVASTKAALEAVSQITPVATTAPGAAMNSVADSLITNESRYVPRNPQAVIRVAEQECFLKITKTF